MRSLLLHRRAALTLVAALLGGCARRPVRASSAEDAARRPYVVLVSFDAFRADYAERLTLPSFRRLAAMGVHARAMIPGFPSKTFPNHYSIVTGLYPGDHGIVANAFWDPVRRAAFAIRDTSAVRDASWYGGEPIWVGAERQGVRTASMMWPASEAPIGGLRPSTYMHYDESLPNAARVDSVAAWLRRPDASRPHLVTMYVSTLDKAGHDHGPFTPATDSAVFDADRVLGRLLDSLAVSPVAGHVDLIVVSDHGMMGVAPERIVDLSRWIPMDGVRTADPGPVLSLWFGADSARRESAYAALAKGLAGANAHARVYRRAQTPAAWHVRGAPRAGDLLVVADPGWIVVPAPPSAPLHGGTHGWDPLTTPEMGAIFYAAGPDIGARGVIPAFPNVEVYGVLAGLLRLDPPVNIDGDDALWRRISRSR